MPRRRAIVLLNRRAGRGDEALTGALRRLEAHFRVEAVRHSRSPRRLADAVRGLARRDDVAIVGGGDGTVNAVVPAVRERGAVLGVLPLGTANDLARTLGLPGDPLGAAELLAREHEHEIDLGRANDVFYLNVASLGLAVDVARRLEGGRKRRLGALAYPLAAFDALRATRDFGVRVDGPGGRVLEERSIWLAVGNGRFYGGGTPIAEDAAIDDGHLDLRSLRPQPLRRLLPLALAIRRGTAHRHEGVDAITGTWLRVETSRRLRVGADGELQTHTPVTFEVCPKALRVLTGERPA
jgi:YegS/Rv2252/BmrU family lipid kinase